VKEKELEKAVEAARQEQGAEQRQKESNTLKSKKPKS